MIADSGVTRGIFKTFALVGLFQVAVVPERLWRHTKTQMGTYDTQLNSIPDFNFRTWVLMVLELLQNPVNGHVIVAIIDLNELGNEIIEWANSNARGAQSNDQPRPIGRSSK